MSFHATKKQMHKAMKDALMLGDKVVLCDTDGKATSEQFYHTIRRALEHTDNVAIHLHKKAQNSCKMLLLPMIWVLQSLIVA